MEFLFNSNDPESRKKVLAKLDEIDERYKGQQVTQLIKIKKNSPIRSLNDNARFHAICTAIAAEIGETMHRVKYDYCVMFIPDPVPMNGHIIPRSTSDLKEDEMKVLIKKIEKHAKDFHGISLRRPEDSTYAMWERYHNSRYDAMFASIDTNNLP